MNTFNKQIDILCMEFDRDMSILEDSMVISEYDGSYFTEASNGNKENFFKKAIRKVKEFIQNIISKLEEKFSKNKLAQKQKAFEIECQKDPSKRNKKVKVRVNDKVYTLSKKAMNDLMKCKTKEEAEKYMEDYRKKREKIVAASVVTITAGSLFAFLGTKLSKTTKQLNSLQQEHEKCVLHIEKQDALIKDQDDLIQINTNLIKGKDDLINAYKKSENNLKSKNKGLEEENSKLKSAISEFRNDHGEYTNKNAMLSMALQRSATKASIARSKILRKSSTVDSSYIVKVLNEIMKEAVEYCGAEFSELE